MSEEISLKELLDTTFSINENGEMVGEFTLKRINMIGDILTDQYKKIIELEEIIRKANNKIKMALDYIQNAKGKDINYVATLLLGYPIETSEMREQFLESIGSDK